ncbi:MAG: ABC transporter permease, partial [Trueperaceae bacterium]|nr:ABC transporter permease [Trueperaceae bacterium]
MISYLARRLLTGLLVIVGVTVMVFGLTRLAGDPAALMLPPSASAADIAAMRARLGLDDPLPAQYLRFLAAAVRGDFGKSLRHGEPALPLLIARLPATFELGIAAVGLALVL